MTDISPIVLACVAHPDDEILGCGGTLARHAAAGDQVAICIVADGVRSRSENPRQEQEVRERRDASFIAARIIGATSVKFLDFEDQRLDSRPILDITQAIERVIAEIGPDVIYTHHDSDLNRDHCAVAEAVITATRPVPGQKTRAIFGFEVLSSTEWAFGAAARSFAPSRYVEISTWLDAKVAALEAYAYEMRSFPHARSIKAVRALAQYRGANVGVSAAEAFSVYREVFREGNGLGN